MAVFGLIVEEDDRVRAYFKKMASQLQSFSWLQPLKGNVGSRSFDGWRLYVIDVEPIYSRYVFNVMVLFLVVAAVTLQMVFSWTTVSLAIYGFAAVCALLVNMFWSARFYEVVIRVQVWRLVGWKVKVRPGTNEALRGLANGKV